MTYTVNCVFRDTHTIYTEMESQPEALTAGRLAGMRRYEGKL